MSKEQIEFVKKVYPAAARLAEAGGVNPLFVTAQAALDDFSACLDAVQSGGKSQALTSLSYYNGSSMHALYQANETLGKAIDLSLIHI